MRSDLPGPLAAFIETTNAEDTPAFLECFTDDAYLNDWGREFHGHDGVASWNESDNIGMHSRFELVEATATTPGRWELQLRVSGDRFNGVGTLTFELVDDKIASLVIT